MNSQKIADVAINAGAIVAGAVLGQKVFGSSNIMTQAMPLVGGVAALAFADRKKPYLETIGGGLVSAGISALLKNPKVDMGLKSVGLAGDDMAMNGQLVQDAGGNLFLLDGASSEGMEGLEGGEIIQGKDGQYYQTVEGINGKSSYGDLLEEGEDLEGLEGEFSDLEGLDGEDDELEELEGLEGEDEDDDELEGLFGEEDGDDLEGLEGDEDYEDEELEGLDGEEDEEEELEGVESLEGEQEVEIESLAGASIEDMI